MHLSCKHVLYRIGSLENSFAYVPINAPVLYRIGSLETLKIMQNV